MVKKSALFFLISFGITAVLIVLLFFLVPGIRERVEWRINETRVRIDYFLNPPEESVFIPNPTSTTNNPAPTRTPQPSSTPTTMPTPSEATITAQPSSTPYPKSVTLSGVRYEDQHGLWNYCGPANLSMALSFWGWEGDRTDTGTYLKPFEKDKNVMLYEMADFVNSQTVYKAIVRSGGTLPLLKKLIAAGFPVLVEKGVFIHDFTGKNSWMGHYTVLTGYDDTQSHFISQDSYFQPDYPVNYDQLLTEWRGFNYLFLVVYDPALENDLFTVLGDYRDETTADRIAYEKANEEIYQTQGSDLFFAWYNRGTNMVYLQDYGGAAEAFDQAFVIYSQIDENTRPWRITWYRTEPYAAYYFMGRYQDVINLATLTINNATEPYLEENFYWRARAYINLGQTQKAIDDLKTALEYHPNYAPALNLLNQLGAG